MRKVKKAICTKSGECGGCQFTAGDELVVCGGANGIHLATEDKNDCPIILLCYSYLGSDDDIHNTVHIPVECRDEYYDPAVDDNLPEFMFEEDIIAGTIKFRSSIDKKEPRSRRVQLLMKPSIYSELLKITTETNRSFNNVVESILDYALNGFVKDLITNKKDNK